MVLFEALIWHSLASGFRAEADGGDAHRHRMRAPAHASELRERLCQVVETAAQELHDAHEAMLGLCFARYALGGHSGTWGCIAELE